MYDIKWGTDESPSPLFFTFKRSKVAMKLFTYFYEDELEDYFFKNRMTLISIVEP